MWVCRLTSVLWWTDTIAVAFLVHRSGHSGSSQPPVRAESVDGDRRVRAIQCPLTGVAITGCRTSFSCTARGGIWGWLWNTQLNSTIKYSCIIYLLRKLKKKFLSYSTDCSYSSQVGRQRHPPAGQWPATETDSGRSAWQWPTSVWQFLRNRYRSTAPLICRLRAKGEMELLEAPSIAVSQINVQVWTWFSEHDSPTVSMVSLSSMSSCARGMSMCMRRVCCCLFMVSEGLVFLLEKNTNKPVNNISAFTKNSLSFAHIPIWFLSSMEHKIRYFEEFPSCSFHKIKECFTIKKWWRKFTIKAPKVL